MHTTWKDGVWVDIGCGVAITEYFEDGSDHAAGLLERHECVDGTYISSIPFRRKGQAAHGPRWLVRQRDPWTLYPSILCPRCGLLGYIQEGKWMSADGSDV
jgi:hypothetical protein